MQAAENSQRHPLDQRIHAFDSESRRAEQALQGQLEGTAWQWFTPAPAYAGSGRVSLLARPEAGATQVTEALPGETLEVLWEEGDWQRVRTCHDGYLGWVPAGQVRAGKFVPDLTVTALRGHAFAEPKVSAPILAEVCLGARLKRGQGDIHDDGQHRRWVPVILPAGGEAWVQEVILTGMTDSDPAALALRFLEVPYVWGGRSAWGLDCSGLMQTIFAAFGHCLPRDADQQQAALQATETPRRNDLAFFPGHVGLMLDEKRMIHANATGMRVTIETLGEGDYGTRLKQGLSRFGRVL